MDKIRKSVLIIVILCGLSLTLYFVGELALRAYQKITLGIPYLAPLKSFYDKDLGWEGKKVFGDTATNKIKIFIVGDSYTWGGGIPEEQMYYNILKNSLGAELFVYGGGGYGTLQEYLVIDKYFDAIKPDLIILQTCSNDFVNNLWELEKRSYINNNMLIRPYLVDGKIKYLSLRRLIKAALLIDSRLMYFLNNKIELLQAGLAAKGWIKTVEKDIEENGMNFAGFKKSVAITGELMSRIKKRAADTPVVVFSIDDPEPYYGQFRRISQNNNMFFIEGLAKLMQTAEVNGTSIRNADRKHWNKNAHKMCGDILSAKLIERRDLLLKKYFADKN